MSPCPPLIITRVCPWLINHLSDPWNFNKSNGILLRSNWRKPYPKFYGSELLIIKGRSRKPVRRYLPTFWGGEFINPVLALCFIHSWNLTMMPYHPIQSICSSVNLDSPSQKRPQEKTKRIHQEPLNSNMFETNNSLNSPAAWILISPKEKSLEHWKRQQLQNTQAHNLASRFTRYLQPLSCTMQD